MVKGKKIEGYSDEEQQDDDNIQNTKNALVSEMIKSLSKNPGTSERYECFKNSKIDSKRLKKFIENKFDVDLTPSSSIVIAITMKIFCGEIVERARELMTKNKLTGPVKENYLKQAYRDVVGKFKGPIFEKEDF